MDKILKPIEAAKLLNVTCESLRSWMNKGKIKGFTTPNGHRRFFLSEIEKIKGQKIRFKKSLFETHPEIAKEWHPDKNGELTVHDVTKGLDKRVWWKCNVADTHEWQASLLDRTKRKNKCPFCARKNRVDLSNCLSTTHPHLISEWSIKNEKNPFDFLSGNKTKVLWKCSEGHEWLASINNRTKPKSTGCPICIGNTLLKEMPFLSKEWHPTKNGILKPQEVHVKSGKKVWWKCDVADDHEWEASICNRSKGSGCPCCSNFKVVNSNCLATTHPNLIKEWHHVNILSPHQVTAGSTKRVLWKCEKNHEWEAVIFKRANYNTNCPYCKSSLGEKLVETELNNLQIKFQREWTHNDCICKSKLRFDFALFDNDSFIGLIEYQGIQHFKPVSFGGKMDVIEKFELVKKRDAIKRNFCKAKNFPLLEISYLESDKEILIRNFVKPLIERL